MDDLISRQAAIDLFPNDALEWDTKGGYIAPHLARRMIEELPSAQPEPCGEMVSREVVVKFFDDWMSALDINCHHQSVADLRIIKGDIKNLPSAEPDLNEWCADCKEYDKEKHCCPRFNRVIREALKDTKPKQYTKEELKAFLHGISLRLLSLRSAQHWQEDDERAKEIEFMAHLYEKVEADMKGKT